MCVGPGLRGGCDAIVAGAHDPHAAHPRGGSLMSDTDLIVRPIAEVRVLRMPHLHPDAVRVVVDCRYSTTGLTVLPGPMLALSREQLIASAVLEHEALCGSCDTEQATDRAWNELLVAAQRRYDSGGGRDRPGGSHR
jgi:hypothetical protein